MWPLFKIKKRMSVCDHVLNSRFYPDPSGFPTITLFSEGSNLSVQLLSRVRLFVTPWIAAHQASLSITNSQSSLKLIKSVMSSWWCHPAISSSVVPFSSCPQSLPASGSFPVSQLFAWGGQSAGASAFTLWLTLIFLVFILFPSFSYPTSS